MEPAFYSIPSFLSSSNYGCLIGSMEAQRRLCEWERGSNRVWLCLCMAERIVVALAEYKAGPTLDHREVLFEIKMRGVSAYAYWSQDKGYEGVDFFNCHKRKELWQFEATYLKISISSFSFFNALFLIYLINNHELYFSWTLCLSATSWRTVCLQIPLMKEQFFGSLHWSRFHGSAHNILWQIFLSFEFSAWKEPAFWACVLPFEEFPTLALSQTKFRDQK